MRKRIFEIVEVDRENGIIDEIYAVFMIITIVVSIIPLCFHYQSSTLLKIDQITVIIFVIDYILRLITADFKLKKGAKSFILYPFTAMAIIDLLSILPSLTVFAQSYRVLKLFRLMRTFKVLRVFKSFRYSRNVKLLVSVFKKQKDSLLTVLVFALAYIIVSALVMFNAEPQTFPTMFDAIYWATVSLTTVGYGDVYATSEIGKLITMISAILGIAVVALPAGIIMAGYQEELAEHIDK